MLVAGVTRSQQHTWALQGHALSLPYISSLSAHWVAPALCFSVGRLSSLGQQGAMNLQHKKQQYQQCMEVSTQWQQQLGTVV